MRRRRQAIRTPTGAVDGFVCSLLWLISKNGPTLFSSNSYAFECYCNVDLYLEYR